MSGQPSGTVTLVFTDIEGSTRLLYELGEEGYREALSEHRRVVRSSFARFDGYEVEFEGDAFFFAFRSAQAAVDAVTEATRALDGGPIRIRVGVHTGEPGLDPPKYVGMDVHRAARIMSVGHGGQVLLSKRTRELVEAETVDLGEHRLKDLHDPVWLYQLGTGSFAPLKSLRNTNLPVPASSFHGRQQELMEAETLAASTRLLTITGPGGSGKTRFAIELARGQLPRFPNGVFWVNLAPVRDHELVLPAIAQTLGAKTDLGEHIADKRLLLLLDNLEHLLQSTSALGQLLENCPNLTLLATSRELLRIRGEREHALAPLNSDDGIKLFCDRANLEPTDAIAELCRRLDNLPLALELAAARMRILNPDQLLQRLGQRLDLLRGGRDAEQRQQTLRATIEWSYDLLEADEKNVFAGLGVFAGGCTLEAAEAISSADIDTLQALADKSLVRRSGDRYWLLETLRQYAEERLNLSDGAHSVRTRHAEWFLECAQRVWAGSGKQGHETLLGDLDQDRHNVAAGMLWALDSGEGEMALRYGEALWEFWYIREYIGEGARLLTSAIELADDRPSSSLAWSMFGLGDLLRMQGEWEQAYDFHQQALQVFEELKDLDGQAAALMDSGNDLLYGSDRPGAEGLYRAAIDMARNAGSDRLTGYALNCYGFVLADKADKRTEATEALAEALELLGKIGDDWGASAAAGSLGTVHLQAGDLAEATAWFREELIRAHGFMSLGLLVDALHSLAIIAARCEHPHRATRLFAHADRLLREHDVPGQTLLESSFDRDAALAALGPETYEALSAEGAALTLDEAVTYALSGND